jgi:hypothetical protein
VQLEIQQITVILLVIWFVVFVAGRFQQNQIRKKLFHRIESGLENALKENPELTLNSYYSWVFVEWESLVKQNARFVLSKNEIYPVAANPDRLKERWNLTPIWLGAYMKKNDLPIKMTEQQEEAVDAILNAYHIKP